MSLNVRLALDQFYEPLRLVAVVCWSSDWLLLGKVSSAFGGRPDSHPWMWNGASPMGNCKPGLFCAGPFQRSFGACMIIFAQANEFTYFMLLGMMFMYHIETEVSCALHLLLTNSNFGL